MLPFGRRLRETRRRERGQSFVEAALSLPIVLLLMMGVIDLGFVLYAHVQVAAAAAEGARAASRVLANLNADGTLSSQQTQNAIDGYRLQVVKNTVSASMGRLSTGSPNFDVNDTNYVDVSYPSPSGNATRTSDQLLVSVHYKQVLFFTVLPWASSGLWRVGSTVQMRIQ